MDLLPIITVVITALGIVGGYCLNNKKARTAIRFTVAGLTSVQACEEAITDGTITPEEERNIGRAVIQAYKDGGEMLKALLPEDT